MAFQLVEKSLVGKSKWLNWILRIFVIVKLLVFLLQIFLVKPSNRKSSSDRLYLVSLFPLPFTLYYTLLF